MANEPYLWNEGLLGTRAKRRAAARNLVPAAIAQRAASAPLVRGSGVRGKDIMDAVTAADEHAARAAAIQAGEAEQARVARNQIQAAYKDALEQSYLEAQRLRNMGTAALGKALPAAVTGAILQIQKVDRDRKEKGEPGIGELLKQGFAGIKEKYPGPAARKEARRYDRAAEMSRRFREQEIMSPTLDIGVSREPTPSDDLRQFSRRYAAAKRLPPDLAGRLTQPQPDVLFQEEVGFEPAPVQPAQDTGSPPYWSTWAPRYGRQGGDLEELESILPPRPTYTPESVPVGPYESAMARPYLEEVEEIYAPITGPSAGW